MADHESQPAAVVRANTSGADTPVRLTVNGKSITLPHGEEVSVPDEFAEAALNSGYDVTIVSRPSSGGQPADDSDGVVAGEGGGTSLSGGPENGDPAFNAEAVIVGNVDTVVASLSGLTVEQLEAVRAAETDREKPRTGVLNAIEEAVAAAGKPASE